ncbi:MAG: phosphoesterase, partial [Verrucomicrobia bacterium]|nr:phosphoesterase [Verrucomicrobiota bacterium]
MKENCIRFRRTWVVALVLIGISVALFARDNQKGSDSRASIVEDNILDLPTGQQITPDIIPGSNIQSLNPGLSEFPDFVAGGAIHSTLSPDGSMLAILTSGFNLNYSLSGKKVPAASKEYVFIFDVKSTRPVLAQVLSLPNSFAGLAFGPRGERIYVGGGKDDNVHIFTRGSDGRFAETEAAITLGHSGAGVLSPDPAAAADSEKISVTAGLAVTADGKELVIANTYQDSITIIDLAKRMVKQELDLRPGKIDSSQAGVAGGEYPFWVAVRRNDTAYVSSIRDREIVVVYLGDQAKVTGRIKLRGNPNKLLLNLNLLFATCDNSDSVEVIDTDTNAVVESIPITGDTAPTFKRYSGSAPNSMAISADGKLLYVTNGGSNSVAIIELSIPHSKVIGLLPTTFYPTQITLSKNGRYAYVINGKSITGPNDRFSRKNRGSNQYVEQLLRSSLLTFPIPAAGSLGPLTLQVLKNNGLEYRLSG